MFPIIQEEVAQAIQHDTKLKKPLYEALGYDVEQLKKNDSQRDKPWYCDRYMYEEIARNIRQYGDVSMSKALTIARTEGHQDYRAVEGTRQDTGRKKPERML